VALPQRQSITASLYQRRFASEDASKDAQSAEPVVEAESESAATTVTEPVIEPVADPVAEAIEAVEAAETSTDSSHADLASSQKPQAPVRWPPAGPPEELKKIIYVANLFFEVDEATLKEQFSQAGEVTNLRLVRDAQGMSKG
jgi:nucleolin